MDIVERLAIATAILAMCFTIGLLIFVPARWLAFRSSPESKHLTVPNKTVALWIGTPVFCVYAFAINAVFGGILFIGVFILLGIQSFVEYSSSPQEQKQALAEALDAQSQKPIQKTLRYLAYGVYAYVGLSILWKLFS